MNGNMRFFWIVIVIFLSLPKAVLQNVQVHMRYGIVAVEFLALIGWLIDIDVVYC